MMASVTSAFHKALRQLEKEREGIDRQITAIQSLLKESGNATKSRPAPRGVGASLGATR